jgi:hypothetical protein
MGVYIYLNIFENTLVYLKGIYRYIEVTKLWLLLQVIWLQFWILLVELKKKINLNSNRNWSEKYVFKILK